MGQDHEHACLLAISVTFCRSMRSGHFVIDSRLIQSQYMHITPVPFMQVQIVRANTIEFAANRNTTHVHDERKPWISPPSSLEGPKVLS